MRPPNRFLIAVKDRPVVSLTTLVSILLVGVLFAFVQGQRTALDDLELTLDRSAISRKNLLQRELQNPLLVPEVLAATPMVRALLVRPSLAAASEQSAVLEETAINTGVEVLYVMDLNGDTLATSNWRASDSFVGKSYKFRPYFQQAIAGQTGRYVAKGVTSGKIGYYLARPVSVDGHIRGVVVAKNSLDALQSRVDDFWREDRELNLVSDLNGVLVAAPLSAFVFKSIAPMTQATRTAIEVSRQYGNEIGVLPMTQGKALSQSIRLVQFSAIPGQSFLQKSYFFPDLGMRLYLHLPASRYWQIVAQFTAMFSLLALVIFLVCVGLFQRWSYTSKLIETAIHDPLTGLHTRLYMGDWCAAAIRVHNRDPGAGFGLVVFDLDLFKQVNDKYGHLAGDDVLRRVGEIVRNALRGEDLAVRFGGEELALFVRCVDLTQTLALAERIRRGVERFQFHSQGGLIPVTLSGGVAYHTAGETLDALFARADQKLYEAKERGRNQIRA
jgi:diguanylate cyclase (GGDEF)-like protein